MSFPHLDLAANAHDRAGDVASTRPGSTSAGPTRRPGCWWSPAPGSGPSTARSTGVAPATRRTGRRVLLGERDGRTWFAVLVDPARRRGTGATGSGCAALLPHLAGRRGPARRRWCSTRSAWRSGTARPGSARAAAAALASRPAGHALACADCGKAQFPRTDPAVIMAVTHGDRAPTTACLLGRQAAWPEGRYSTLAGFFEPGETLEDAVRREVPEEVGVPVGEVDLLRQPAVAVPGQPDARLLRPRATTTRDRASTASEIEDARWFTREEMRREAEAGTLVLPGGISI